MADAGAQAIATNEPPALVDDEKRHLGWLQRRVNLSAERLDLGKYLFLNRIPQGRAVAQEVRGEAGHVIDDVDIDIAQLRIAVGIKPEFKQTERPPLSVENRRHHQRPGRGVARRGSKAIRQFGIGVEIEDLTFRQDMAQ